MPAAAVAAILQQLSNPHSNRPKQARKVGGWPPPPNQTPNQTASPPINPDGDMPTDDNPTPGPNPVLETSGPFIFAGAALVFVFLMARK